MHTHLSLFEGDDNAFLEAGDPLGFSKTARAFIAGILEPRARDHRGHEPDGELLQAADPRLRGARVRALGARQPVGARARALPKRGKGLPPASSSARPTPPCNPYLAFSVMLAAGSKGIEEGYELPSEARQHLRDDPEERAPRHRPAPQSLAEALDVMEQSSSSPRRWASTSSSGSCATSAQEWIGYKTQVTRVRARPLSPQPVTTGGGRTQMEPLLLFPDPPNEGAHADPRPGAGTPGRRPATPDMAEAHRA